MINNELINRTLIFLRQAEKELEENQKTNFVLIEQVTLLRDSYGPEKFNKRFNSILDSFRSGQMTRDAFAERVKSLIGLLETQIFIEDVKLRSDADFDVIPFFSVDGRDRDRLLSLCENIRALINKSEELDNPTRNRLLKRVAAMELELNKDKGMVDTFLAGLADVGEAAGKFGSDIKPLVDRFSELASAVRGKSQAYVALPPKEDQRALPPPDEDETSTREVD